MAGKFLTILFICVLPLIKAAADDESPIVCSDHWHDETECENNVHCKFVIHSDQQDNTFCVPKCTEIDGEEECKKYAGCTYNGAECIYCERGSYCPGNSETYACATVDLDYSESQAGADSSDLCYKSCTGDGAMTCGIAKPGGHFALAGNIICLYTMDDNLLSVMLPSQEYHSEGVDGCYLNTRDCSKFTTAENDGTSLLDKEKNIGYASWNQSNGYDVTNCRHVTDDETDLTNCIRKTFYKPLNSTNLQNAQGVLRFWPNYTTDVDHLDKYFCIECLSASYYPLSTKPANIHKCQNPDAGESYKACQCQAIPQGYYSSTGQKWTIQDEVHTPPESYHYKACPAGKTTGGGAVSADECHYSRDTKFCDANGCFNITDADSGIWNWDD